MTDPGPLTVPEVLRRLGGSARAGDLRERVTGRALATAVRHGDVIRVGRGSYVLPDLPSPRQVAARARGVLSHLAAAEHWGLPVLLPPDAVHVSVPHGSRPAPVDGVRYHWCTLAPDEVAEGATTPLRTVLDCATGLSFREALAVADAALRADLVDEGDLWQAAHRRRGPGSRRCRRVVRTASPEAANPFESALRAVVVEAELPGFVPQHRIAAGTLRAQVDLADPRLRLAVEGDSYTYHGTRGAFVRDCRRYDELVRAGWTVLRFTWEHVMFEPSWVAALISDVRRELSARAR